jgi:hypothetical protein
MEKAKLADACWALLAEMPPVALSLADIAERADCALDEAILYGGDVTDLILFKLDALDSAALAMSADDFADDPDATIYEKLLEGLMMRFEALSAHRVQFDTLHYAAKKQPLLALHLTHQLSHTIGKLLMLAGDESEGLIKQARILGVVGVLLRVRSVWSQDEGADLGLTLKALDDELKKACEWAVSLRVLSKEDVTGAREDSA